MEKGETKESVMFTYSTKELTQTDKVKFHYSLKGRNGTPGLLKRVIGNHIGGAVIIVPKEHESLVVEFFQKWEIPFEKKTLIFKDEKEQN